MKKIKKFLAECKRYWIPAIGWFLFGGFFCNCVLAPYIQLNIIEWSQLLTALAVMLTISGARDIGLKKQADDSEKTVSVDGIDTKVYTVGKRYWIPGIGWCLALGFLNNCVVYPFMAITPVDWMQLLTGLGVMLGISGTRDIFLNRNKELAEKVAKTAKEAASSSEENDSSEDKE